MSALKSISDLPALQITPEGLANFISTVEKFGPHTTEFQIRQLVGTLTNAVRGGNILAGKALLRLALDMIVSLDSLIDEKAMKEVISGANYWPLLFDETVAQKNYNDGIVKRLKDHRINASGGAKTFKGSEDLRTLRWNFGSEINRLRGLFEGLSSVIIPASKRLFHNEAGSEEALTRAATFLDEGARRISPALFVRAKDMDRTDLAWEWLVEQTNGTPERLLEVRRVLINVGKSNTASCLATLSHRRDAKGSYLDPVETLSTEIASQAVEEELRKILKDKFYAAIPSA